MCAHVHARANCHVHVDASAAAQSLDVRRLRAFGPCGKLWQSILLSKTARQPVLAGESSESTRSSQLVSFLDRLKSPRPSDLARKRKIGTNPPPKGKRTCRGQGTNATEPKGVTPFLYHYIIPVYN